MRIQKGSTSKISKAVIYMAIFKALQTSPSVVAARLAADNLICIVYFTTLFALASKIPTEDTQSATDGFKVAAALMGRHVEGNISPFWIILKKTFVCCDEESLLKLNIVTDEIAVARRC